MTMGNVFKSGKQPTDANLQARAAIVEMAQQMGAGQRASQLCPACDGGASKERSLSLNVDVNGMIKFYCHRSACGFQGTAYTQPGLAPMESSSVLPGGHLRPLIADLYPLSDRDTAWFAMRFGLMNTVGIRRTQARYALPLIGPQGSKRGWITRRPWDGSPADTETNRNDSQYGVKALTFLEADEPVLSWYHTAATYDVDIGIVLVEDQISAMRLIEYAAANELQASACALLGVGLNAAKVAEIQRTAFPSSFGKQAQPRQVRLALDKDATGQAFAMARKWGMAFRDCGVIVLSKDIKDSSDDELEALPL